MDELISFLITTYFSLSIVFQKTPRPYVKSTIADTYLVVWEESVFYASNVSTSESEEDVYYDDGQYDDDPNPYHGTYSED